MLWAMLPFLASTNFSFWMLLEKAFYLYCGSPTKICLTLLV